MSRGINNSFKPGQGLVLCLWENLAFTWSYYTNVHQKLATGLSVCKNTGGHEKDGNVNIPPCW